VVYIVYDNDPAMKWGAPEFVRYYRLIKEDAID
jgi:hypothetical protein